MIGRLLFALMFLLAACDGAASVETTAVPPAGPDPSLTTSTTVAAATETTPTEITPTEITGAEPAIPVPLDDFAIEWIGLDGVELLVAVADTSERRRQGLMNIEDLGGLDGMLFVFDRDGTGGFWMKDTLIPLDIAFFDAGGEFVDGFVMEPCTVAACPTYRPSGTYRFALEMPAGQMPETVAVLELNQDQ